MSQSRKCLTTAAVLRRSALAIAMGAALSATPVLAQQSAGSINGQARAGDKITIVNKAVGLTRTVTVDKDGGYVVSQLPPGDYQVVVTRSDGSTRTQTVAVVPGKGSVADFNALDQVIVTGSAVKTIDMKSTESATLLNKADIDRIPVVRDVTAIALLAPGAVRGDGRIGNVPSLGGASPAENAYYINGFNVTNIVNGIAFNSVPFEGIANQQVKTGGYGAEYGRSLGGVISVTTKRGTDEWHGGVSASFEPASLRGSAIYFKNANTDASKWGNWQAMNRPGDFDRRKVSAYAGGALVKDTLYGFGLVQLQNERTRWYGNSSQYDETNKTPQYLLKLDWNVTKNNLVELTAFNDKTERNRANFKSPKAYETARGDDLGTDIYSSGGDTQILKWTSWLTDDLTVSALYGVGRYSRSSIIPSSGCEYISDERGPEAIQRGCATQTQVGDPAAKDKRTAYRFDVEYALNAKHTLRAGLDSEVYLTHDGTVAPGASKSWWTLTTLAADGQLPNGYANATGAPLDVVSVRYFENGGDFRTENSAWYIEDNWQATKNLLVSAGLRSEAFTNKNGGGKAFIDVKNTFAPRLAAAWDVAGDGKLKVYSNLGRYYIPVYANTNVRLSGKQGDWTDYYKFGGSFSADKLELPALGAKLGERKMNSDGTAPDPRTIVDPNIKPMFQDEFIIGFQKALVDRWSGGVKYTHRALKNSMDDVCSFEGAYDWARKSGKYTEAQARRIGNTISRCFLANPGKDLTANVDLDGKRELTAVTIPAEALRFPVKPKRTYDALEFTVERAWDKKWSLQGSYVLAFSKGTTEGYIKSDIGQRDAGIGQDWDHPGLMEGSDGYLPNDRRHTFKLWGSYAATDEWRLGANLILQSGRPRNCLGTYAGTIDSHSIDYGSTSFYCMGKLTPRGTAGRLDWTKELNLQATYTPRALKGMTFSVDLLNVFNARTPGAVDEQSDNGLNSPRPAYGQPDANSVQQPRRVRLMAQYEF